MENLSFLLNPLVLIESVGLLGIFAVVFAESGLFFGFFLPGDSLLFTAGLLSSQGFFNIVLLFLGCFLAAVLGDNVGYSFGKFVGPKIFSKEDSFFFHKKHIDQTQIFYAKYGKKAIILARFVPIVRTFAPILAGVGRMHYPTFFFYNVLGGFIWNLLLISLGFFLGNLIPDIDKYILPIIAFIILVSFIPIIRELWINRRKA